MMLTLFALLFTTNSLTYFEGGNICQTLVNRIFVAARMPGEVMLVINSVTYPPNHGIVPVDTRRPVVGRHIMILRRLHHYGICLPISFARHVPYLAFEPSEPSRRGRHPPTSTIYLLDHGLICVAKESGPSPPIYKGGPNLDCMKKNFCDS